MIVGWDATNSVHALWHAQGGVGVVAACTRRLEALLDYLQPSAAVACFDRRSFRHDLMPGYKAHREEKPAGLVRDLADAEAALGNICPIAFEIGYEADDCLATLAAIGRARGEKVVLASPDKDLRQCLARGEVTILRKFATDHGAVASSEWYTADTLAAEYKLPPEAWPQYQALCGDSTDSIPGCEGIGDVTAAKILKKAGSIEAALKNPLAIPVTPKQRVALGKFKEHAELMLKLVTLRIDVASVQDALR